jgi:hypothetical protein
LYFSPTIAQQMIPEGVERRLEDWSIFFLNRESTKEEEKEVEGMDGTFINNPFQNVESVIHTVNAETNGNHR